MVRWPLQIVGLVAYLLAFAFCTRARRKNALISVHLSMVWLWLLHAVIFHVVVVIRILYCGGEPPLELWITLWANVAWLHGGITLAWTLIWACTQLRKEGRC